MANQNNSITALIDVLNELDKAFCNSESANRQARDKAIEAVNASGIDAQARQEAVQAISSASNPSGWYYECSGIKAGIAVLAAYTPEPTPDRLNYRNLSNLVSDGSIFSVEFVRRTDGKRRKMICRMGVTKHLRGGKKAYNPAAHDLLTVFDMENKGYRSIPVDAILSLCVNGQSFTYSAV